MPNMTSKNINIDFLRYAELDPEDVKRFTDEEVRAFISPDVKSFHLVWVYKDWYWAHEIVDYADYSNLSNALEHELCDDSWDSGEAGSWVDFLELLSDWEDYTAETPPQVMTLRQMWKSNYQLISERERDNA